MFSKQTTSNPELIFVQVEQTEEFQEELYLLLQKRSHNISNLILPSYEDHCIFMRSNPYLHWYLIKGKNGKSIGDAYVMDTNCVGINITKPSQENFQKAIDFITSNHEPLPAIKSVRPDKFYVNVSPDHIQKIRALENCKCSKLQLTYTIGN